MATIEWNTVQTINNRLYTDVIYSEKDNKFYTIGMDGGKTILYIANSIDGTNWTEVDSKNYTNTFTDDRVGSIFYIKEKDIYIAFIPNETKPDKDTDCITSTNGFDWMYQSTIKNYKITISDLEAIIVNSRMVNDIKRDLLFYTLTQDNNSTKGSLSVIITSSNGKNWNIVDINTLLGINVIITSMTYNKGKILFTCIDNVLSISYIVISEDVGNTWSINFTSNTALSQIISTDKSIICFGIIPDKNGIILTSNTNKISWTETPFNKKYYIYNSLYINGLYTVLGYYGNTTTCGCSFDGINWIFNPITNTQYEQSLQLAYSYLLQRYITLALNSKNSYTNVLLGVAIIEPICLPSGTPILTDQGTFPIEKLDISSHTISGKRIVAVTETITPESSLVCFEKNSLSINCPSKRTIMTSGHEVLYKGQLVQAKHFVGRLDGVHTVPYDGKVLYNVLHEVHGLMNVNNMTVETLNPTNRIAKSILQNIN